jgi:MFS family permease
VTGSGITDKAEWRELFRDGRGIFSLLIIGGVSLHALNVLVIAIVMPTVVADVGGADYYTWPTLVYTIGSIVGAASVGPIWAKFGQRRGYAISGFVFMLGTLGCALAPDIASLIGARGIQGYASGLTTGGGMALVSTLFPAALRTRIIAMNQGVWMVAQLMGPAIGGIFAELGWWRGSFWTMVPILLAFSILAWLRLPDRNQDEAAPPNRNIPVGRIALLASGVFLIAFAGVVESSVERAGLIAGGLVTIAFTILHLDRKSENRLYPTGALSFRSAVGLSLWVLLLGGLVQTSVPLFLPLLLQVVHDVRPIYAGLAGLFISLGWTVGTFAVSGWSGSRERFALWIGPILMAVGLVGVTMLTTLPFLWGLIIALTILGLGVGTHNVHLLARTMGFAAKGEERITASALPSFRSLGTAIGAAVAGILANVAGLGDATQSEQVGTAVTFVYGANLIPLAFAIVFMFLLIAKGDPPKAENES